LQDILARWNRLYDDLSQRHTIQAPQRFASQSFEALAQCDGLVTLAAYVADEIVACHLWIQHEDVVWSHLAASSLAGYEAGASYAIYDRAIRLFAPRIVSLGGAAGTLNSDHDGLARFKAGFANRQLETYLAGEVLDKARYCALTSDRGIAGVDYFPAYRATAGPVIFNISAQI